MYSALSEIHHYDVHAVWFYKTQSQIDCVTSIVTRLCLVHQRSLCTIVSIAANASATLGNLHYDVV